MNDPAFLTALALLVTACGTVVSAVLSFLNGRSIRRVEKHTNGMSHELREVSRKAGLVTGRAEGRASEKAEHPERKRHA